MTFKEGKELYMDIKQSRIKESSVGTYAQMWKSRIEPALGHVPIENITRKTVMAFVETLKRDGLSNSSISSYVMFIKSILNGLATEFELSTPNTRWPLLLDSKPKLNKIDRYTAAEAKRLIAYCIDNPSNTCLAILIGVCCGLRVGEVCALRFDDVDFDLRAINVTRTLERIYDPEKKQTKIHIGETKTSCSTRIVPLTSKLFSMVKAFSKVANPDYYIATGSVKPTEPRTLRNALYAIEDKAKVPRLKFHGLRHTFASLMVSNGAEIKTLSSILGHSNVGITMDVYCHPNIEDKRKATQKTLSKIF